MLRSLGCIIAPHFAYSAVRLSRSSEPARCPRASPRHNDQLPFPAIDQASKEGELPESLLERRLELRPALHEFRALLAGSWSPATAYPESVTPSHWSAGDPRGQCGVSTAWLAEVLHRDYSIASTFCRGSLTFSERAAQDLPDHCWLEITPESGEDLVLDLTCDQAHGFDREIVFDLRADLDQESVHYIPRERVDISDLPNNPVWPRYQELLHNMAA